MVALTITLKIRSCRKFADVLYTLNFMFVGILFIFFQIFLWYGPISVLEGISSFLKSWDLFTAHVTVCLSVCPLVRRSISPLVHLSGGPSVRRSVSLLVCWSVGLSLRPSIRLSVHPCVMQCEFIPKGHHICVTPPAQPHVIDAVVYMALLLYFQWQRMVLEAVGRFQ